MIVAGTSPPIYIGLGKNEPGMKLQRLEGRVWVDYLVDGEVVILPVKIDQLPPVSVDSIIRKAIVSPSTQAKLLGISQRSGNWPNMLSQWPMPIVQCRFILIGESP